MLSGQWERGAGSARRGGTARQNVPLRSRRADWAGAARPCALIGGALRRGRGDGRLAEGPAHPRPRCPPAPPLACREGTGEGKGRDVSARPRPPFCSETAEARG